MFMVWQVVMVFLKNEKVPENTYLFTDQDLMKVVGVLFSDYSCGPKTNTLQL